ncbi:Cytochrome P [Trema orientale]|uniref:Trans-cinnamate 4-monooxygenase n=1 Tax=Trema orientale TaxID=63057 RepID=A0A2P5BPM6_TREOI|nr:Cytochrome P [Trema orientale]
MALVAYLGAGPKRSPQLASTNRIGSQRLQLLMHNNLYMIIFDKRGVLAQSLGYNYGDFIPILRPFLRGYLNINREACEKRLSTKLITNTNKSKNKEKLGFAGIGHILEAQQMGEITKDNVHYLIENMNVAAKNSHFIVDCTLAGAKAIIIKAPSLEWAIADVANHPEVQKRIQIELDTVLGPGIQITERDIQKLLYLQAVIEEVLKARHGGSSPGPSSEHKRRKDRIIRHPSREQDNDKYVVVGQQPDPLEEPGRVSTPEIRGGGVPCGGQRQ